MIPHRYINTKEESIMKKHISTLLCLGILLTAMASLAACVNNGGSTETVTETETKTETATEIESTEETTDMFESDTVADTELTESETEAETEAFDYSPYAKTIGEAFVCSSSSGAQQTPFQVAANTAYGSLLTVAKDCYLTRFAFFTHSWSDNIGEMEVSFWPWAGNYNDTVAAEPAFTYVVKDSDDNSWVFVDIPATTVGSGKWYYEFRNGSENPIGISLVSGRAPTSGDVQVENCYRNGSTSRNICPRAYVTYEKYDTTTEINLDPANYTKLAEGKAHVILLAGQSNATGISLGSLLGNHYSEEQVNRYYAGYENILIDYASDNNASGRFVPVKMGQGNTVNSFGPELGLADYLSRTFPGETFYIIKATSSGSSLFGDWGLVGDTHVDPYGNPTNSGASYTKFINHVNASLGRLENMGLEPEIFAMMWMQGETDSWYLDQSTTYFDHEVALLSRFNAEFGDYMAEGGMAFLDAAIYEGSAWTSAPWVYAPIVNNGKLALANSSQNYYFLDTNVRGIDPRDEHSAASAEGEVDIAHYDSDDMIELGELFGEGIAQVLANAGYTAN